MRWAPLVLLGFASCGGAPSPKSNWVTLQIEQGREQIIDVTTGREVTFQQMITDLAATRVVYVGEQHDSAEDHAIQYAVLDGILAKNPSVALGLEMFQKRFQAALDAWTKGEIDEAEMLERAQYEARWGVDFDFYRPILETAKAAGARILALNAPTEVTRAIAHGGLQALDPLQISELPDLKLDDTRHRELVRDSLAQHGLMEKDAFERYYAAQVVWDESMALRVAQTMNAPDAPSCMVVMAGRMHVESGTGIPERAGRRGAKPWKIVLTVHPNDPVLSWKGKIGDRPADYLWVIPHEQ